MTYDDFGNETEPEITEAEHLIRLITDLEKQIAKATIQRKGFVEVVDIMLDHYSVVEIVENLKELQTQQKGEWTKTHITN